MKQQNTEASRFPTTTMTRTSQKPDNEQNETEIINTETVYYTIKNKGPNFKTSKQ